MRESFKVIEQMKLRLGAEIGVLKGDNAKEVLIGIPEVKLFLIDNNLDQCMEFLMNNLEQYKDRVGVVEGWSEDCKNFFPNESLDFVYLDANHKYADVKNDLVWWWPKVKKGGLFCGHDYNIQEKLAKIYDQIKGRSAEDVGLAVDEFAQTLNLKVEHKVNENDQGTEDWWIIK